MRIKAFEWDDDNLAHIADHQVSSEEAEEVFDSRPMIRRTRQGYYLGMGHSEAGRYLLVVFELKPGGLARVISARDMSKREQKSYRQHRR